MNRSTKMLAGLLALLALAACGKKEVEDPLEHLQKWAQRAEAASMPPVKPLAQVSGDTYLVRIFDAENGVTCYVLNHPYSAPSCLRTAEPKAKP